MESLIRRRGGEVLTLGLRSYKIRPAKVAPARLSRLLAPSSCGRHSIGPILWCSLLAWRPALGNQAGQPAEVQHSWLISSTSERPKVHANRLLPSKSDVAPFESIHFSQPPSGYARRWHPSPVRCQCLRERALCAGYLGPESGQAALKLRGAHGATADHLHRVPRKAACFQAAGSD
jgi:hypothetical protein